MRIYKSRQNCFALQIDRFNRVIDKVLQIGIAAYGNYLIATYSNGLLQTTVGINGMNFPVEQD